MNQGGSGRNGAGKLQEGVDLVLWNNVGPILPFSHPFFFLDLCQLQTHGGSIV